MMINKKHLVLLLSSSLFLSACTTTQTTSTQAPTGEIVPTEVIAQNLSSSLRDLIAKGTSMQCAYEYTDPESKIQTKSTLYISGDKFAQDAEINNPADKENPNTKMSMISDGTNIYTWNPDKKETGMKFLINKTGGENNETNTNTVDLDKKMDMNCSPWLSNSSKFTPPVEIKFSDLSELMKNIPGLPKDTQGIPKE